MVGRVQKSIKKDDIDNTLEKKQGKAPIQIFKNMSIMGGMTWSHCSDWRLSETLGLPEIYRGGVLALTVAGAFI